MPAFQQDLEAVLERARASGVDRLMTCATSLSDARVNVRIAEERPEAGIKASIGFHPHQASEWDDTSETELRKLMAASRQISALGEVGLDFHYNFTPPGTQQDVLRRQIALARSVDLPLIIHCRNAGEELRRILVEERAGEAGGVLHCFSEEPAFARFCLDQGLFISFSGIVTFKKAEAIREAARLVPLDRLLVETDSPYLAPVPHRGKRNEPAFVVETMRFLAGLRGETVEELSAATTRNFETLFSRTPRI